MDHDADALHAQLNKLSLDNRPEQAVMKKKRARKPKEKKENKAKDGRGQLQEKNTQAASHYTGRFVRDPHSTFPLNHRHAPQHRNMSAPLQTSHHLSSTFPQPSASTLRAEIATFVPRQEQPSRPPRCSARLVNTPQVQPGYFQTLCNNQSPSIQHPEVPSPRPKDSVAKRLSRKLPRPTPSPEYITSCQVPSTRIANPRKLLVVLDLNGVLVFRKRGLSHKPRPDLIPFLDYLFANHSVMVWSSGMPANVETIIQKLMSPEQCSQLVTIWARDTLRIPPHLYGEKVQVYKQLSWIWENPHLQSKAMTSSNEAWDQSNTVLIDDSREKAAAEPSNLICVDEFINSPEQQKRHTLLHVVAYLEKIRRFSHVSTAMRESPFLLRTS